MSDSKKQEFFDTIRAAEAVLANTPIGEAINMMELLFRPSFGSLTDEMSEAIREVVKGKRVFDIQAGDCSLSHTLLQLGAHDIVAIDKQLGGKKRKDKRIKRHSFYVHTFMDRKKDMPVPGDVAFLSWPANCPTPKLLHLLSMFETIIYLGKNTDNTSCAFPELYFEMLKRPLLRHISHRKNTMLVLGKSSRAIVRCPTLEELGGLDHEHVYEWKEGL